MNLEEDTKARILKSAMRLFRQRGYHATGLADILQTAGAPKGSLYHHFPKGKEQIGIAVIGLLLQITQLHFSRGKARTTQALVNRGGTELLRILERSEFNTCCLFSSFAGDRQATPALIQAVAHAYAVMGEQLAHELMLDGFRGQEARERALAVMALLEGGFLIAIAYQAVAPARAAIKTAARLCQLPAA